MAGEEDRKQIGLTTAGQATVEKLTQELRWFAEGQDAGRFALAYAISREIPAGQTPNVETRWAVGGFDPTGEIQAVIRVVYPPTSTPVRLMEHLIDQGLRLIEDDLRNGLEGPLALVDRDQRHSASGEQPQGTP